MSFDIAGAVKRIATKRGQAAVERLIEKSPGFAGVALWIRYHDAPGECTPNGTKTYGWTDGKDIWHTTRYTTLPPLEQVGVTAHEFLHVALRHVQRGRELASVEQNFCWRVWNYATDAIINEYLSGQSWLALPDNCVVLSQLFEQYREILKTAGRPAPVLPAPLAMSCEDVYRWLKQARSECAGLGKGGQEFVKQIDSAKNDDLQGDRLPIDALTRAAENEEARDWRMRLERARAGDRPGGILRRISGDLPTVTTPWEKVLRTKTMRALAREPQPDPCRPSRRWTSVSTCFPHLTIAYEIGRRHSKQRPRLTVIIDVSGSIDADLLKRFMAEIISIARITQAHVTVVACDAKVQGIWELGSNPEFDLSRIEIKGGGGTDFEPGLDAAQEARCDAAIYLTDLEGTYGPKRRFPVIWAVHSGNGRPIPDPDFGSVIALR